MAFDGSGRFNRLYNWVADAANNLFISAPRMDAEMDGMAAGLSNCITRDGQSPATADIPLSGHRIITLANGVNPTDAVALGQLTDALAKNVVVQWSNDSSTASFVSTTPEGVCSFKVVGVDKSSNYSPGRRFLIRAGTAYETGTVTGVVYTAPDTIVTGVLDVAYGALSNPLDQSWYGMLEYTNPAYLSPRTAVAAVFNHVQDLTFDPSTFYAFPFDTEQLDAQQEFDDATVAGSTGSYKFKPRYPGNFRISGSAGYIPQASGTFTVQALLYKNNVFVCWLFQEIKPMTIGAIYSAPFSAIVAMPTVGDYLQVRFSLNANWKASYVSNLAIDRIV